MMKKLAKEPGGKPLDEDKGMDVNWRPTVENKPSSQSSSQLITYVWLGCILYESMSFYETHLNFQDPFDYFSK